VNVAEARVTRAEKDLAEARAELAEASAEFCGSSETYLSALDRYGDLLRQTAVTVGDVNDAGTDLEQPRDEVMSDAEVAVAAQQEVTDAKQGLAEAEAALATAKTPGSSAPNSPAATSSPKPLAPAATVNRVKQAESELTAVQAGITDETPLALASEQFNAAVVALEMAWLRLFVDAGCLTDEEQVQAEAAVHAYTTTLQTSLSAVGYYTDEVDGIYGAATVDAVETLQGAHDLPSTGTVDKATAEALHDDLAAKGGATAQEELITTAAVQQTLKIAGFWDGPVDGDWSPELTAALKEFQSQLGVKPTGAVDAATVAALKQAIAELSASASASGSATTSDSPTPSHDTDASSEPTPGPTSD
jgi:murein L,D-transpeptidase YcbB/YkuD